MWFLGTHVAFRIAAQKKLREIRQNEPVLGKDIIEKYGWIEMARPQDLYPQNLRPQDLQPPYDQ
jgi:hypothetical protein